MSNALRLTLYGLLSAIMLASSYAHAQHHLAISNAQSVFKQPGKFIWADLITADAAKAARFYTSLLGWDVKQVDKRYFMASNNGRRIAGFAEHQGKKRDNSNTRWIPYISSRSPDNDATYASENGGSVHIAPKDIEGRGRFALLSDSEGALFGVLNSISGDPEDHIPDIGEWVWQELWASKPNQLAQFYLNAGYEKFESLPSENSENDIIIASGGYARASIVHKTDARQQTVWLMYVRVENIDAIASKATQLGGQVLMQAEDLSSAYPVIVLADNTGGVFAAVEWSPAQDSAESQNETAQEEAK